MRSAARRLGISIEQVREQEEPTHDLMVSELQAWQRVLEVPINDLLVDCEAPLSAPVLTRARLLEGDENRACHQRGQQVRLD